MRAAALDYAGRVSGLLLGVATTALLARTLSVEEFGLFSTASAIIVIFHTAVDSGFRQSATRLYHEAKDNSAVFSSFVALRGLVGVALCVASAAVLALLLGHDGFSQTWPLSITLALAVISASGFVLQAELRTGLFAITLVAQSALWLGLVIAADLANWSLFTLAYCYVLSSAFQAFLTFIMARYAMESRTKPSVRPDISHMKRLLVPAIGYCIIGGLAVATFKADAIIVYQILGSEDAGLYASAYRIFEQFQTLAASVATVIVPVYASKAWNSEESDRVYLTMQRTIVLVSTAAFLATCICAANILRLLYGTTYSRASAALVVLCLALPVVSYRVVLTARIIASRSAIRIGYTLCTALAVNILLSAALVHVWGINGAAGATLATEVCIVGALHVCYRDIPVPLGRRAIAGLALLIVGSAVIGLLMIPGAHMSNELAVGTALVVAVATIFSYTPLRRSTVGKLAAAASR